MNRRATLGSFKRLKLYCLSIAVAVIVMLFFDVVQPYRAMIMGYVMVSVILILISMPRRWKRNFSEAGFTIMGFLAMLSIVNFVSGRKKD